VAGIDEAGRGALAGPVVAAAVILERGRVPAGIRDSKLLAPAVRERLYDAILAVSPSWGVGVAEADEIDACNILEATRRAMVRAVEAMPERPDYLIIDAVRLPALDIASESPTKADRDIMSVAAASIVAKVTRDRLLVTLDTTYREYGFAAHKGYGTLRHLRALNRHGPCPIHRKSFAGAGETTLWSAEDLDSLVQVFAAARSRRGEVRPRESTDADR
jgi:ribonuclease HII